MKFTRILASCFASLPLALPAAAATLVTTPTFEADLETASGYSLGSLVGQVNWGNTNPGSVSNLQAHSGTQSLRTIVTSAGWGATHALVGGVYPTSTQGFNINSAENWWVQAWVRVDSGGGGADMQLLNTLGGCPLMTISGTGAVTLNSCVAAPTVPSQGVNVLNQWILLTMVHTTDMNNVNGAFMQFSITGDNVNVSASSTYSGAGSALPVYIKLRGDAYWDDIRAGYGPLAAAVPVPAAAWLFGSALGLLGMVRRHATTL